MMIVKMMMIIIIIIIIVIIIVISLELYPFYCCLYSAIFSMDSTRM